MQKMTLEEIKDVELGILRHVTAFCDSNHLQYFLAYGTLLGAVRHQGFIPWDDDIDIQMPRDDYNKLIDMFNKNRVSPHLRLIAPSDPISRHTFVKIIDDRTVKIEDGIDYDDELLGVDIDVFPLDGEPEDDGVFMQWYEKLQKIYRAYSYMLIKKGATTKRKLAMPIIRLLNLLGAKKGLRSKADRLHQQYPYHSAHYVGSVESTSNSERDRTAKECYDGYLWLEFEGQQFKCPVGYHAILTQQYDDYMLLPPIENRITHHGNTIFWKDK